MYIRQIDRSDYVGTSVNAKAFSLSDSAKYLDD